MTTYLEPRAPVFPPARPRASTVLFSAFAALGLAFLAGCATSSAPTPAALATVRPEQTALTFDDPQPVFDTLFPGGTLPQKTAAESDAAYRARLAVPGQEGRVLTFLLPAKFSRAEPRPDGSWLVASTDYFFTSASPENGTWGLTVAEVESERQRMAQDGHGAPVDATILRRTQLKLAPPAVLQLPRVLRWTVYSKDAKTPFSYFGLPLANPDPAVRARLEAGKLRLALRVRLADLARLAVQHDYMPPGRGDPVGLRTSALLLPVALLDVWIVDTGTGTSVVHWQNPSAG